MALKQSFIHISQIVSSALKYGLKVQLPSVPVVAAVLHELNLDLEF